VKLRTLVVLALVALAGAVLATVPSTSSTAGPYTCNGSTTVFSVPFRFLAVGDLVVTRVHVASGSSTTLAVTTDYTVVGAGAAAGGSVTLVAGSRCGSGYTLLVTRQTAKTQPRNLRASTQYQPATVEAGLDQLAMVDQDTDRRLTEWTAIDWTGPAGPPGPQGSSGAPSHVVSVTQAPYNAVCNGSTDDTAAIQAAVNAVCGTSGSGGTVIFPASVCRMNGQLTFPTTGSPPTQKTCRLMGVGATGSGIEWPSRSAVNGGSVIDAQYATTNAKILTVGRGLLEITGITFTDTSGSSLPFLRTTGTTLRVHNSAFVGSKNDAACDQDAIQLGGTNPASYQTTDPNAAFQGYGTVIRDNFFDHIRRAVHLRVWANGNVITGNAVWRSSGTNQANGAVSAIEIDGTGGGSGTNGNYIAGNLIEAGFYPYCTKITNGGYNQVVGNTCWNDGSVLVDAVWLSTNAFSNFVLGDFGPGGPKAGCRDDTGANGQNVCMTAGSGGRIMVGGANSPTGTGNLLGLYAGSADHVYQEWFPRTADPYARGGYFGFTGAGATDLTLGAELGNLVFNAPAGKKATFNRSITAPTPVLAPWNTISPTNGGTVNLDASANFGAYVLCGAGVSAITIANPTNPTRGQEILFNVANNSGGAITTTWGNTFKMATWADAANGYMVMIRFVYDGSLWRETARSGSVPF
jgi:hypothetical protein